MKKLFLVILLTSCSQSKINKSTNLSNSGYSATTFGKKEERFWINRSKVMHCDSLGTLDHNYFIYIDPIEEPERYKEYLDSVNKTIVNFMDSVKNIYDSIYFIKVQVKSI